MNYLNEGFSRLSATQNFSHFYFDIDKKEEGGDLNIEIIESKQEAELNFGLHYDGLYKSGVLLNATFNHLISQDLCIIDRLFLKYCFFSYIAKN